METPKLLKIINATYLHDMVLELVFSNGARRICDFEPLSEKGVCRKLKDPSYFKNFSLDPYTVDWNNEIGFAPEFLYQISTPKPYNVDFNDSIDKVAENL